MQSLKRAEQWMFAPGDARQVAALRIGLCGLLIVRLLTRDFTDLSGQPSGLYRPVSFMHLFSHMPSSGFVHVAVPLAVVAALFAGAGLWSRAFLPVAWVLGLALFGMTTSTGKIMHNDVLMLLCLTPLVIGTTDDAWSLRSRGRPAQERSWRFGWPARLAVLIVVGAYFFSGLAKLIHSGPAWAWSDNLRWILYANSDGRGSPNLPAVFVADHRWLARVSACAILGTELFFPVILWRWSLRYVFLGAAILLHAGTWITLGLNYLPMATVATLVMVSWPDLFDRRRRSLRGRPIAATIGR